MTETQIKRGALFFLLHPGEVQFSGYGLTVEYGKRNRLAGILMVDRPQPASIDWLKRVEERYGRYELYPMTRAGERGIACQMWVTDESLAHVRQLSGCFTDYLQAALLPLLFTLPNPRLQVTWDATMHFWRSEFHETVPADGAAQRPSKRLGPLFPLGQVVATPGAIAALEEAGQLPQEFLYRHVAGDWGDLDEHDLQINERALRKGQRLLSVYSTKKGDRVWIITEWDRSVTTLLTPDEY